jgi:hypothetical protein
VDTGARGVPLALAAGGHEVLVRDPTGRLLLAGTGSQPPQALPAIAFETAGWVPGRPLVWLAGAGLRLLTLEDPLTLTEVVGTGVRVQDVRATAQRVRFLQASAGGLVPMVAELGDSIALWEAGPPLDPGGLSAVAWADGGEVAAIVRHGELRLLDLGSGEERTLAPQAAFEPMWTPADAASRPDGGDR